MFHKLSEIIASKFSPDTVAWLYDNTPPAAIRRIQLQRFRATVRHAARNSPFYRRRFAKLGIDPARVRTPRDLADFYTTPQDLADHAEDFIAAPPAMVFESSGTSGRNKRVYFGRNELQNMGTVMAGGMRMMGIARTDRVANAFDFSIWIPGWMSHYGLMAAGNFCQAFGKVDPIEVYRRLQANRLNVVMGEPTWLIRLTELAERHGSLPLKLMIGGAEEMPAAAVPWIKSVWQGATVKMCYGSVEQGIALGFQPCDRIDGYHLNDVDFLPEIIEQDPQGFGEVVFTTLSRQVMPLIRYRTRDIAQLIERCPCGRRAPAISRLRGRTDDLIVASGGNLYPRMFEEILASVPGLGHDFQVTFDLEGMREVMTIRVESTRADRDALEQQIKQEASLKYPDLMKNLALGIFEMRISIEPPGQIRTARKLKRMLDRRHFAPSAAAENGHVIDAPPSPVRIEAPIDDPADSEASASSSITADNGKKPSRARRKPAPKPAKGRGRT
jgi:phenylacetate-CoA ligase